jgi:hypothetical protein
VKTPTMTRKDFFHPGRNFSQAASESAHTGSNRRSVLRLERFSR